MAENDLAYRLEEFSTGWILVNGQGEDLQQFSGQGDARLISAMAAAYVAGTQDLGVA